MSFLTAILGGLGGYTAGRQQHQQTQMQQQRYDQEEADRQRGLAMDEAKYRDAAQQILANRGTDPKTAQWNPQTMQYEGGTPFAMPKGWEQVPTDPQQAAGHFMRLLNIYSQQNRGQSDPAQMALTGYQTAETQLTEAQKARMQMGLEQYKLQGQGWLKGIEAGYAHQGRVEEAGYAMQRLNITEGDKFAINKADHDFTMASRNVPTLQMMYSASSKEPDKALDAARATDTKLDSQLSQELHGLDASNRTAKAKLIGAFSPGRLPNPFMDKFTPHVMQAIAAVRKDPSQLKPLLDKAQRSHDAFTNTGIGFSDDQFNLFTKYVTQVANTQIALRAASHSVNLIQRYYGIPQVPGVGGGSNADPNPRYPGP